METHFTSSEVVNLLKLLAMEQKLQYYVTPETIVNNWSIAKERQKQRPPLGLKPVKIHHEERKVEIEDAILRYVLDQREVPHEWLCELQTLNSWLQHDR